MTRRTVLLAGLLIGGAAISVVAQEAPSPALYQLLPFSYPHPLIRVCRTDYGICLIPSAVRPGTPCYCRAANGAWLPGVCVH